MSENNNISAQKSGAAAQAESSMKGRGRFITLKLGFALFFVVIAGRLTQVQVLQSSKYQSIARKQY